MSRTYGSIVLAGAVALFGCGLLFGSEADELREKAAILQKQAVAHAEKGNPKEAEQLLREAEKLRDAARKQEEAEASAQKSKGKFPASAQAGQIRERLQQLIEMEQKLRNSKGHEEDHSKVRHEIAAAERQLALLQAGHGAGRQHPGKGPHDPNLDEAARRIQHMRIAAENLKQAELPDVARQIAEKADAMEKELHENRQRQAAEQKAAHGPHEDQLHDVVKALREEVERLRNEVRELNRKIEQK